MLTNLISNAIKYSRVPGDIRVTSTVTKFDVTLCVKDRGVGISKDHQAHVFDRFYRISTPEGNNFPGLGLGLYISHEIIKRQYGSIWVDSEEGKGSTFCFTLPLDYRINLENNEQTIRTKLDA